MLFSVARYLTTPLAWTINEFAFRLSNGRSMDFVEAICSNRQNALKYRKLTNNYAKTSYRAVKPRVRESRGSSSEIYEAKIQFAPAVAVA